MKKKEKEERKEERKKKSSDTKHLKYLILIITRGSIHSAYE